MEKSNGTAGSEAQAGAVGISVTAAPSPADLATIGEGLSSFNDQEVGPANRVPLAVLLHDSDEKLVGGISGYTAWGWVYIQWLWLDETHRGKRLAGEMLKAAEAEGRARGCHGSYIDTFSPIALKAYQRAGYLVFGELKDFPKGRTRTFLSKPL